MYLLSPIKAPCMSILYFYCTDHKGNSLLKEVSFHLYYKIIHSFPQTIYLYLKLARNLKGKGYWREELGESGEDGYLNGKSNWEQVTIANTPISTHILKISISITDLLKSTRLCYFGLNSNNLDYDIHEKALISLKS